MLEGEPFFDERGRFRLADARELVASRLAPDPAVPPAADVGAVRRRAGPIWVDDPRFDVAYHVRLTALPNPGTREQLLALFERVQAQVLDRSRPLWELWFVEGLEGGNVAVIQKTHHALVDGISGVDVATVLFDFTREPTVPDAPEWVPTARAESPRSCFVDTIGEERRGPGARAARRSPTRSRSRSACWHSSAKLGRSLATLAEGRLRRARSSASTSRSVVTGASSASRSRSTT